MTSGNGGLLADARGLLNEVVAVRRESHAQPELGLHLPATQSTVLKALARLPLTVFTGARISSVVAVLDSGRPGPTTLLRGDMDALPLTERTGLSYASRVAGVMHACGHDAHTAMLIGAATLLTARRDQLDGRVIFMFQPGEEGAGGAKVMLEEGILERYGAVDRAFALHIMPSLPSGVIAARPGPTWPPWTRWTWWSPGRGDTLRCPTPPSTLCLSPVRSSWRCRP
ncbi:M20/M25/M40 family metallo-hydrolase [Streptomyces sp. NPDC005803]|uniref:M20 metallopeptidase family protein n=1 Tax=Streptomyces sp. NPDC005803 TaxID=3154297 RepID=UPI0033CB41B2